MATMSLNGVFSWSLKGFVDLKSYKLLKLTFENLDTRKTQTIFDDFF